MSAINIPEGSLYALRRVLSALLLVVVISWQCRGRNREAKDHEMSSLELFHSKTTRIAGVWRKGDDGGHTLHRYEMQADCEYWRTRHKKLQAASQKVSNKSTSTRPSGGRGMALLTLFQLRPAKPLKQHSKPGQAPERQLFHRGLWSLTQMMLSPYRP